MSELPTPAPASSTAQNSALDIVLFGRNDAGKSSLLGALLQASQTQEHILMGHLTDVSQRLAELQRRLYEGTPRETVDEIVPYPVVFEPFGGEHAPGRLEAVLVDCDGRVANELLARRRTFGEGNSDGTLAQALVRADALVLAVDASLPAAQIDADFVEFGRFLKLLQEDRGQRTEIGGMPVFLVLTKCDLLAQPGDSPADWMDRIEERKRQVHDRFDEFPARQPDKAPPAFGRIDLHLWATAVKRPQLAGSPALPRDPYGVAELFRQCLDGARVFRKRRERSALRLWRVAAGSMALLLTAGLLVLSLPLTHRLSEPSALEKQIDHYRAHEQEQSTLARHRQVQQQLADLEAWVSDPDFAALPRDKQAYVRARLEELQAYRDYEDQLLQVMDPRDARSRAQLDDIERDMNALVPPPVYREAWSQTDAEALRADRLEDIAAIRRALGGVETWYQKLAQEGRKVLDSADAANLPARARKVLDADKTPPFPDKDPDKPLPGARQATYATLFGFTTVADNRRRWDEVKKKLEPLAALEKP
jgi:hypothetical protein